MSDQGMLGKSGSVRTALSCRRIAGRMRLAGVAGQGPQVLADREVQILPDGSSHLTLICTSTSHRSVPRPLSGWRCIAPLSRRYVIERCSGRGATSLVHRVSQSSAVGKEYLLRQPLAFQTAPQHRMRSSTNLGAEHLRKDGFIYPVALGFEHQGFCGRCHSSSTFSVSSRRADPPVRFTPHRRSPTLPKIIISDPPERAKSECEMVT